MDLDAARRSVEWRAHLARRQLRAAGAGQPVERLDVPLLSTAGYRLSGRLTRPRGGGPLPGVVVSPAIHHGRDDVDGYRSAVSVAEVARLGYAVLTFDPAGRGESWGEEDFGG